MAKRTLNFDDYSEAGIIDILKKGKLLGYVTKIKPLVKQLVLEYYVNLSKDIQDWGVQTSA